MLELTDISKSYGEVQALKDLSVTLRPGEIHAVLGENGAGKSTLASIVAGFVTPDVGDARLEGKKLPLGKPLTLRKLGIEMIHQHFTLVPAFTVEENLALGRIQSLGTRLDLKTLAAPAMKAAADLGWNLDPTSLVRTLSVGMQQRLEILKALAENAKVILFDEPTAVLTREEVVELQRVLFRLRDEGKIIGLIAHKLSEVMAVADRVTVLRQGRKVAEAAKGEFDETQLANWMVGEMPAPAPRRAPISSDVALKVENLSVKSDRGVMAVQDISFSAKGGEVFGIGGVDGNGQLELAEALAGVRSFDSGVINWSSTAQSPAIDSKALPAAGGIAFKSVAAAKESILALPSNAPQATPLSFAREVGEFRRTGREGNNRKRKSPLSTRVAYIPQDRRRDGLALGLSILDNMMIAGYLRPELTRGPFLRLATSFVWSQRLMNLFSVQAPSPKTIVSELSGGNQQKVVVSRNMDADPPALVVSGPGRGLDIQATAFVHEQILKARDQGCAVILFSTDLDELLALSDRVVYMSQGRFVEGAGAAAVVGGAAT